MMLIRSDEQLQEKFARLVAEWRDETAHLSSITEIVMHPKYQNIIGLGPDVLPLLFREMQRHPDHWFWALRAITEENPITPEDVGYVGKNYRNMAELGKRARGF